jgi:hypothetical protein
MVPGRKHSRQLNSGAPDGFVHCKPDVKRLVECSMDYSGLDKVFAIISTWNDSDIIAENVQNCLREGVDGVYILDNASSDDSVVVAMSAGACFSHIYSTEFYDDDLRIRLENEIAERIVKENGDCWIVSLDADEFIHGLKGDTLAETLRSLPLDYRTVGSYCVDLYPESKEAHVPGVHPGISMPRGSLRKGVFCSRSHWKHSAIRYSNGVFDLAQIRGNHFPASKGKCQIFEPAFDLPMLHAPFRNYGHMRWRLSQLCDPSVGVNGVARSAGDDEVTGSMGASKRWQSLENVYAQRWDQVEIPHCHMLYGRPVTGVCLYPWKKFYQGLDLCNSSGSTLTILDPPTI